WRIETMVRIRRALCKKPVEQALPPTTEAWSAPLPACSAGFDNIGGGPECGVYIQMRGVEQVRLRRGFQGGRRPARVALVPPPDIGQDVDLIDALAGVLELGRAATRPHLGAGGDKDFHVGIGKDHRSNVAAIEHGAGRGASEIALEVEERRT